MIITCPNCETKYRVAGTEATLVGRTMRCKQCKYEWVYRIAAAQPIGILTTPRLREASKIKSSKVKHDQLYLNAIKVQGKSKGLKLPRLSTMFFIVPLGLLVLGVGLTWLMFHNYWVKGWPAIAKSYETVGIYPTEGCIVHSFYIVRDKDEVVINGVIENTAEAQRKMPALKISVFFKAKAEGEKISGENTEAEPEIFIMPSKGEWLAAGQKHFFYEKIVPRSQDVEKITVEVVNFLDPIISN